MLLLASPLDYTKSCVRVWYRLWWVNPSTRAWSSIQKLRRVSYQSHRLGSQTFVWVLPSVPVKSENWLSSLYSRWPLTAHAASRSCACAFTKEKEPTRQPPTDWVANKWPPQITLTSRSLVACWQTRRMMSAKSCKRCVVTESLVLPAGVQQLIHLVILDWLMKVKIKV